MEETHPKPLAVVSSGLPEKERARLAERFEVFPLPPDPDLPEPTACHPDMILTEVSGTLFFSRRYAGTYPALIRALTEKTGMPAILSDAPRSGVYPSDVGANAFIWKRRAGEPLLIGRLDSVFPEALMRAKDAGIRCVFVRQGYAACSSLPLPDALLTSDEGILKSLRPYADNVYWVPNDGILLPGYDTGFLGGTCGVYETPGRCEVFFSGDPSSMEYAETLSRLLDRFGAEPVLLSDGPLVDRGGIRFLQTVRP